MGPTSAPEVLVLPGYGRVVRRKMGSPFKGLTGSNTVWTPIYHALKCGGGSGRPPLDEFCGGGGCGTKGFLEGDTEYGIIFYMDDGLIVSRHP